ncbi:MAG TPA: hypothetical protein VFE33_29775 [Thermoanaerobaculia bacterium]|nr:hypothetical protein [Thermoanaerobaculia bacterium]
MEDERVDRLLRALPRETASAGFTARVLARLDEIEAAEARTPARFLGLPRITLPAAVLAATLVVAASLSLQTGGGLGVPAPRLQKSLLAPRAAARVPTGAPAWTAARARPASAVSTANLSPRQVAARRAELLLEEIQAEHGRLHDELRQLRAARPGTVYLGGDEDMDLVVHLDRVREMPAGQVRPVAAQQFD